jgi:hypothetical protein
LKRVVYLILGLFSSGLAVAVVVTQHTTWWELVVLAIAPDVSLVLGASPGLERGQLYPPAVPFYNAVHRFWVPGLLVAITILLPAPAWLAGGLAWIAHIAFDRSLGFGLRSPEGFQRA